MKFPTMIHKVQIWGLVIGSFFLFSQTAQSQKIAWEYDVEFEKQGYIGNFWQEANQLFFHVKMLKENYILNLTEDGHPSGITFLKGCAKTSTILPFDEDYYLVAGKNCFESSNGAYDSRLYSRNGTLIKSAGDFNKRNGGHIKTKNGYHYLRTNPFYSYKDITLGFIDWDFKMTEEKVSVQSLKKDDLGIFIWGYMFSTNNNILVTGYNQGTVKDKHNFNPITGGVLGLKDGEIKWTYPVKSDNKRLNRFYGNGTKIGLQRYDVKKCQQFFEVLDNDGRLICSFDLEEMPSNFMLLKEEIVILFDYHISIYNYKGEFIEKYDQYDREKRVNQSAIKLLSNGDFIITGFVNDKNKISIRRLTFSDTSISSKEKAEISNVSLDEISDDLLSIVVFPNPASFEINFQLNGEVNPDATYDIQIFNTVGKIVLQKSFDTSQLKIIISNLASGNYYYKVHAIDPKNKMSVFSGKFIKVE